MTLMANGMQTFMPKGVLELRCMRCGEVWEIPVQDVQTEEWPGFNGMWEQVKFTIDGMRWLVCTPEMHHAHHCPDGGLGFWQIIGITRR